MALNINGGLNLTTGSVFQSDSITRSSVQWSSSLSFIGSAQNIRIQGVPTSVASSTVTLDTADSTYDRFDLIIVSASYFNSSSESSIGTLEKITGTASADPQYPTYNPITQVPLKYVKVKANATVPSTAGTNPQDVPEDSEFRNVLVYNENVGVDGSPKEWNHLDPSEKYGIFNSFDGSNGTSVDPSVHNSYESTDYAQSGNKSIKFSLKPDDEIYIGSRFAGGNGYYGDRWFYGHRPIVFQYFQSDGNLYTGNLLSGISFWVKLEKDLRLFGARIKIQIGHQVLGQDNGNIYPGRQVYSFEELGIERDNTEWQRVIIDLSKLHFPTQIGQGGNIVRDLLIQASINGALPVTDDWYIYFDNIQLHFGSLPSDDSPDDTIGTNDGDTGTGGNTGGGSNVYKEGSGPTTIRPTAGTHKVGAISYNSTIGGGNDNTITGSQYSYIGAGYSNEITGSVYSSLLGGRSNTVQADYSSILGGQSNCVTHDRSFIIGSNLTSDKACYTFMNNLDVAGVVSGSTFSGSFVGDGSGLTGISGSGSTNTGSLLTTASVSSNTITFTKGDNSTFDITVNTGSGGGGGSSITLQDNGSSCTTALSLLNFVGATVTEPTADNVTVTFGAGLLESGDGTDTIQDVIGGHVVAAPSSSIVGGIKNTIACTNSDPNFGSFYNFIGGGFCNTISGSSFSTIIGTSRGLLTTGSESNTAGPFDLLVGGQENIAGGGYSGVIGGGCNVAIGCVSTVVGGSGNQALGKRSSILGGSNNTVVSHGNCSGHSTIIGSKCSTIDTCYNNNTSIGEVIVGGSQNLITGSACLGATLGGGGHTVCHRRSAIIGGVNLTTQAENTTYVENLHVTSSYDQANYLSSILTLSRKETTPDSPLEGMIMASGSAGSSKLYYYDGSSWNALF